MSEETGTWSDYSKLVLKELERLNDNHDKMRNDMDNRFSEINQKLSDFKNLDTKVETHSKWIEKVNDVWSSTQMKSAKDEIYEQKNKWTATIAIITFVQIAVGIAVAVWGNIK